LGDTGPTGLSRGRAIVGRKGFCHWGKRPRETTDLGGELGCLTTHKTLNFLATGAQRAERPWKNRTWGSPCQPRRTVGEGGESIWVKKTGTCKHQAKNGGGTRGGGGV